jgi:hypothetical protein
MLAGSAVLPGGGKESRTPDLMLAKHALYQLSYTPRWWADPGSGGLIWTRTRDLPLIRRVL